MNELEFKLLLNDKLCDVADAILHYYDPCKRRDNICLLCDDMNNDHLSCCYSGGKFDCRDGRKSCEFLKNDRCNFRNIQCKLFLCHTAMEANPECVLDLKDLESIAKRYGLVRRPFLGDRYVGRTEEITKMENRKLNG